MPIHILPQFWHPLCNYKVIAGCIFQKGSNFCKPLLHHRIVLQLASTLCRSSNPLETRACTNTLLDSLELLLLSTKSTDRLKFLTVTDRYIRTLQHIKNTSKTFKENCHQPFSHAVLPEKICHKHLPFSPNFRNVKYTP